MVYVENFSYQIVIYSYSLRLSSLVGPSGLESRSSLFDERTGSIDIVSPCESSCPNASFRKDTTKHRWLVDLNYEFDRVNQQYHERIALLRSRTTLRFIIHI